MAKILLLDTSTAVLSVALAKDGIVLEERVCTEPMKQSSLTAPYVKEVLDAQGISVRDCDAICVSAGPGSYTGLRVGASTAKGLAFGAGKPLIAVGTLDILAQAAKDQPGYKEAASIVPMIDARRMEVYTAMYAPSGERLTPVQALVVEEKSFEEQLSQGLVLFIGDGALKCREVLSHPNARFAAAAPLACYMAPLAQRAFDENRFEDVAYFEPFYLKDFVATVSRKQLW